MYPYLNYTFVYGMVYSMFRLNFDILSLTNKADCGMLESKERCRMNFELLYVNSPYACEPGHTVTTQTHPYHEIVFYGADCLGKTIIGGEEYEFKGGDVAVNRAETPHSEIHYNRGYVRYICFECDEFELENKVYHNSSGIEEIFDVMKFEMKHKLSDWDEMIYHEFRKLLICINRLNSVQSDSDDDALLAAKRYIGENYAEDVSIHKLAESLGYSDSHFRLIFTKRFGVSPQDYLINKRCHKAIELLRYSRFSCAHIAAQCGFYDNSQLTRILKARYSSAPTEIRNQEIY